jgi:hypothetical protein
LNERFDCVGVEEFQLVPYTNEAILAPLQTNVHDLYLPSLEMKTQSHSSTVDLRTCSFPVTASSVKFLSFKRKINCNDFVCGVNDVVFECNKNQITNAGFANGSRESFKKVKLQFMTKIPQ